MDVHEKQQLRQRVLVLALLFSLILWNLPFGGFLLYPFKLFATWLHEMAHGLSMLAVGAGFDHLEMHRDASGLAFGARAVGNAARAVIACAGYVGTAAFGSLFLILGQRRAGARSILGGLAGALALSAVLWIEGDFALVCVTAGAAAFALLSMFASERIALFSVNFVAAQACVNALLDIRVLFRSNLVVGGELVKSDAHAMAEAAFGSPSMWAATWLVWSLALFFVALRVINVRERDRTHPVVSG